MTRSKGITRSAALALLGLPGDASPREITQAYRRLAKATHPDRTGATNEATTAHPAATDTEQGFAALADAYHALASTPPTSPPDRTPPPTPSASRGPVSVPVRVRHSPQQPPEQPPIVAGPVRIIPSPSPAPPQRRST